MPIWVISQVFMFWLPFYLLSIAKSAFSELSEECGNFYPPSPEFENI